MRYSVYTDMEAYSRKLLNIPRTSYCPDLPINPPDDVAVHMCASCDGEVYKGWGDDEPRCEDCDDIHSCQNLDDVLGYYVGM